LKYWKNKIVHFFIFGSIYLNLEVFVRAYSGDMVGFRGLTKLGLMGYTSLWIFPIGGLCGVIIGSLNDRPRYHNLKLWQQIIIGGSFITAVELLAGIFLNFYLHLNLWDYSQDKFNFMGQICLRNCIWWYVLPIVIIWLDDALSYYFYDEEKPLSLFSYFKRLFLLK